MTLLKSLIHYMFPSSRENYTYREQKLINNAAADTYCIYDVVIDLAVVGGSETTS